MTGPLRLELRVLGAFELRRNGEPVEQWPRAGPRQLLKRLVVSERQAMGAEALAESFWPDDSGERVTQRLHHLIYLLRKTLQAADAGKPCLRTDNGVVRLVTGEALWIDLVEFEQHLAAASANDEAALEQALALYRGRLLGDEADEDWLAPRRAQIEGRFVAASQRLATLHIEQGRPQAAVPILNKLLAEVPAHEPAHRELITLYGRLGRAEDVQRQFNECTAILQRELDAPPAADTCSAYQAAQALSATATRRARPAADLPHPSPAKPQDPTPQRWMAPCPLVQLLGRDEAVHSAVQQLHDGVRLLSLVGTGGICKTQLAIRIAHEAQQAYAQGACFVPLAEAQPGDLYPALARALGLKLSRHEAPKTTVLRVLQRSRVLLVVDNFEHMLGDAGEPALLLQNCPGLALLVTSRIRLNLAVETCVAVAPLPVDREGSDLPQALRLFVDCARRIRPQLEWRQREIDDAAAITRSLGGLPLAIELAAARLPLFSVSQLRRAVEASLQVVTGGGADRPPRQRSLQHSFGWSYALLSPGEQSLLLLLGLFDAAFNRHDSQGLAGADTADPELELQRLVELGFIAHRDAGFEVVPAIREFARQRLQQHAERAGLQSRFIDHFVLKAEELKAPIESCEPAPIRQALSAFAAQSPNFFAALSTAHEAGRQADVCRLVMQLAQLWGYSGMWHESKLWIDRATQHAEALEATNRPELMCNICVYWRRHGLVEQALAAGKQAVVFAEQTGEPGVLVRALLFTGATSVGTTQFQLEEFSACLRRARPLAARLPDMRWKWAVVVNQAMIHFYRDDLRRAGAMLAVSYERTTSIGNDLGRAKIQSNLAKVLAYGGKPEAAWANFEQVLATYQGTSPGILAESHLAAAWFHCSQMDVARARQAVRLMRETMHDVDSDYLRLPISLLEGQIALLADQVPL
jgi:predicted ATPase/DNA-binding SARP family transcriptional activator